MKDFEVIIKEGTEKYNEFMEVLGTNRVYIKSPIPEEIVISNGKEEIDLGFMLEIEELTHKQKESLIKHFADKFKQTEEFVRNYIHEIGVPILKEHTILIVNNPQKWF